MPKFAKGEIKQSYGVYAFKRALGYKKEKNIKGRKKIQ